MFVQTIYLVRTIATLQLTFLAFLRAHRMSVLNCSKFTNEYSTVIDICLTSCQRVLFIDTFAIYNVITSNKLQNLHVIEYAVNLHILSATHLISYYRNVQWNILKVAIIPLSFIGCVKCE